MLCREDGKGERIYLAMPFTYRLADLPAKNAFDVPGRREGGKNCFTGSVVIVEDPAAFYARHRKVLDIVERTVKDGFTGVRDLVLSFENNTSHK